MNSVDTAKAILDEIDWEALYKRLTAYGRRLACDMADVFDGVSAEDLVGESIMAYLNAESGMNWDPAKGTLERFLCGVLKKRFLMHVRRPRPKNSPDGDQFLREPTVPAIVEEPPSGTIVDQMRDVANGDKELVELIEAARDLESGSKVNQQLSERLNIPVPDVVNRKKRFARRWEQVSGQKRACGQPRSKRPLF